MVNWINSWKGGNKKNKWSVTIRLGKLTLLEIKICPCDNEKCAKLRVMVLNFGFEV